MDNEKYLDSLQEEVEKLLVLLKDRQYGIFTWNGALFTNIKRIRKLTKNFGN